MKGLCLWLGNEIGSAMTSAMVGLAIVGFGTAYYSHKMDQEVDYARQILERQTFESLKHAVETAAQSPHALLETPGLPANLRNCMLGNSSCQATGGFRAFNLYSSTGSQLGGARFDFSGRLCGAGVANCSPLFQVNTAYRSECKSGATCKQASKLQLQYTIQNLRNSSTTNPMQLEISSFTCGNGKVIVGHTTDGEPICDNIPGPLMGLRGPTGPVGAKGLTGPMGPAGPMGPGGPGAKPLHCAALCTGDGQSYGLYYNSAINPHLPGISCLNHDVCWPDPNFMHGMNCQVINFVGANCAAVHYANRDFYGCFSADTMIQLSNGAQKAIASLTTNDWIWNPVTHKAYRVRRLIKGPELKPLIELGFGTYRVKVTEKHPMLTRRGVIFAKDVRAEDFLADATGAFKPVTDIVVLPLRDDEVVWNLELETNEKDWRHHMVLADGVATGDFYLQTKLENPGQALLGLQKTQ